MLVDLILIAVLVAVRLRLPGVFGGGSVEEPLARARTLARSLLDGVRHPLGQVGAMAVAWTVVGWLSLAAQAGSAVAIGKATLAASPKDTGHCHLMLEAAEEHLRSAVHMNGWDITQGKIPPHLVTHCPYGGEYFIDDDKRLSCTRHGTSERSTPLVNLSRFGKRSVSVGDPGESRDGGR